MAAASSVSPFLPELLRVILPRRDTWVLLMSYFPTLLWIWLCAWIALPTNLLSFKFLRTQVITMRVRAMFLWFLVLFTALPYTRALSQGLTVKWVSLPSP